MRCDLVKQHKQLVSVVALRCQGFCFLEMRLVVRDAEARAIGSAPLVSLMSRRAEDFLLPVFCLGVVIIRPRLPR
jgi:hypothetical protein